MPKHAQLTTEQTFTEENTFEKTIYVSGTTSAFAGKGDNPQHSGYMYFDDVTGLGYGGSLSISGGEAVEGDGGHIQFTGGGASNLSGGNGGDVTLAGGSPDGEGIYGKVKIASGTDISIPVVLSTENLTEEKTIYFPNDTGTIALETGVSDTFTTVDGKTITVVNGLITGIEISGGM